MKILFTFHIVSVSFSLLKKNWSRLLYIYLKAIQSQSQTKTKAQF